MTKRQAVLFCEERCKMQLGRAEQFKLQNDMTNRANKKKYKALLEVAGNYSEIAMMLDDRIKKEDIEHV